MIVFCTILGNINNYVCFANTAKAKFLQRQKTLQVRFKALSPPLPLFLSLFLSLYSAKEVN